MDELPEPLTETPARSYPTGSQQRVMWAGLTAVAALSLIVVAALLFFGFISFLSWSYPILLPIGLAVIVALFLEPFVGFAQKRGMRRGAATLLVCLLSVVVFLLFWAFLLPPLVDQAGGFFKSLPRLLNTGTAYLQSSMNPTEHSFKWQDAATPPDFSGATNHLTIAPPPPQNPAILAPEPETNATGGNEIQNWLKANLPAIQQSVEKNIANWIYSALGPVGQAFGFILGFGFVPIYVYYFLADQDRIANHWHDYVPIRRSRVRDEVISVLNEINASLVSYFRGQIIVAGCNGVLTFLGLWAIGIPYSLVLGIMTGALSIVPFLGIIASILPAMLLGFLSAKDDPTFQWLRPLMVVGVFSLVQLSESMFITPRVQSHTTGLHPIAIILGILFWSLLLPGLLGPVVAVPLTCAFVVLMRRYVWQEKRAA